MQFRTTFAVLLAIALAPSGARGNSLETIPGLPGYVHEVFGVADGLPVAGISQTLQTRDGYLWLATFDGLVRFDGARFEVFDSDRVPALGSNRIYRLREDRDGVLWMFTEQGHLVRYAGGVFTSCGRPREGRAACGQSGPGAAYYTALETDRSGRVWAGGPSGLLRAEEDGLREMPGMRTDAPVVYFKQDRTGGLWAGTSRGLWRARSGRLERVPLPPGFYDLSYPTVAVDARGEVWVTAPRAVGRLVSGVFQARFPEPGHVGEDPRGGVWISLGDRLIYRRDGVETVWASPANVRAPVPDLGVHVGPGGVWASFANLLVRDGRPVLTLPPKPGGITTLAFDREGTLWIATSRAELHALHPAPLATLAEGLPGPILYPVYEDRDGTLWVGSESFVARLAPGAARFESRPLPPGVLQQAATAFLRDRAGTFWMGTTRGLFVLGPGGFTFPPEGDPFGNRVVRALFEDAGGILWAGTDAGLFRRGPSGWSRVPLPGGPAQPRVRVIRQTPDGALWLGANGAGVIRLLDGRATAVTRAQGLSSDLVRSIWVAPDGRLWIGTENRGLNRLDPASVGAPGGPPIATLGESQGLYSNGIHQMVDDGRGNLWMSSNHGIFRVRQEDLDAVADGIRERVETAVYTERDGLAAREANGGVQDAGLRDRDGRLWFPTQAGLARIDPGEVLRRREPPPVHVEGLRVGGEERPLGAGPVRLDPSQRSFTLEFTAPSFLAPERQRFRYRLVPYDHAWIDAGSRREAAYTKVPPGRYRFEVLALGPAGHWTARPAVLDLEVVPRWMETAWFRALAFLAAVAAVAAAMSAVFRVRGTRQLARQRELERLVEERTATISAQAEKLRELDQLKTQFFADVSHELRTPLTLTLGPLHDALDGRFGPLREDLGGQLDVAARNAGRLLSLVDQLLDVARLDAGRLRLRVRRGDLAAAVRARVEAFLPLAERRGIELSLAAPAEPVEAWFDEAQMEKVFDNLIGNALKFTPSGGRVRVAVENGDPLTVAVQDNGPGIPPDQLERVFERFHQVEATDRRRWPGAGIGLALARQLVELHGGTIRAESAGEEAGACFTVALRRGWEHLPAGVLDGEPAGRERRPVAPHVPTPTPLEPLRVSEVRDLEREEDRTTVLVVDDNPEIRAYIRRHLEADYRVVEAADGAEGLEAARRLVPDLVVSDVMMPGLDGNALFRALREDPELEFVPVVLLTAKASAESRVQGLRDGVDDYVVKPFDPRELKARVDNLIASRKRLQARLGAAPAAPRALRVSEVSVTPADESFLARVQAVVEERLGDSDLTVEGLAEALGCDRSYLLRKLRSLTGETPSALIRSLRLQRAEQLLRAGAGSVGEIAYGVGFKSVAHFSNAFHERYGERPSAFAARHRS